MEASIPASFWPVLGGAVAVLWGLGCRSPSDAGAEVTDPTFTLVFEGDITRFRSNPLQTETPFGRPVTMGIGDAFAETDDLRETQEALVEALDDLLQALSPHDYDDEILEPGSGAAVAAYWNRPEVVKARAALERAA